MLGLAPLAAAPLSDDGDRLPRITAGAFAPVAFGGSAAGETIAGGRSQAATLAVGRVISGVGDIHAQCADDINAAGNAAAIGRIIGEAAGSIAATTTATVAFRSAANIQGDIALSGQCAGRVKTAGTARHLWDLEGACATRTPLVASGAGLWDLLEIAHCSVSTQSSVAASITIARRFEAESVIAGAAVRGLFVKGSGQCGTPSVGASEGSLGLDSAAQAKVAHTVTLANGLRLTGYAMADAISSARAEALGPGLAGRAFGTTLEARFAAMFGQIGISVSVRATIEAHAIVDALLATSMDTRGNVTTRSAIAGTLTLARELNADVLASGQAGRQIGLTGAASGNTATAADAPVAGLEVTGGSEARSDNLATIRHELFVFGKTELASSIFGPTTTTFEWAGTSDAITGTRAVVEAKTSLQGESFAATSTAAAATDQQAIVGSGAGKVRPVAQLRSDLAMAGASMGTISSLGLGHGVFDVARDFDGDVAVFGDSARAIGLTGQATVSSAVIGTVTTAGLVLTGSAAATNIGRSKAATQVSLSGAATGQVQSAAAVQPWLKIDLVAESASPQTGKSNGTWATEGHADGTLALMGSAGGGLALAAGAAARATLAARTSGALAITGKTKTALETRADAAGVLGVGRDSDAAVVIDGDAHHSISLRGSCEGQASIAAKPRLLHLTLTLTKDAANAAHGQASSEVITAGSGVAKVQSRAASQGRLPISRTGAADVLILGAAGRGMQLLGASQARSPALAVAHSSVIPRLGAAAANVIHLDLKAGAIAPGGQAVGSNLTCAQDVSAQWELNMTAIAYRAPPALGRSESPRQGFSGRLVPTNAGRVLRG